MDILSVVWGIGTVVVAAVVAAIMGRRRGIDHVEERADGAMRQLIEAQGARIELLERAIAEHERTIADKDRRVAALEAEVTSLRDELRIEKMVSARFRAAGGGE